MISPRARVLRDGREMAINASQLVPGDILILSEGDQIPADGRIIEEYELECQEATLSGESTPVAKTSVLTTKKMAPLEDKNRIFMGTVILADLSSGSNTLTNCSSVAGFSVGDVLLDWSGDFGTINPTITAISGNSIVVNVNATASVPQLDVFGFNGYIKQNLSGSAPNQICEFEFANFTRFGVYDEVINFKVRLYESGNKIEFVYGNCSVGQDNFPSEVGLKGNSNSDFNSREVGLSNSWSTSTAATLITDVCAFESGKIPAGGQSYMWSAVSCTPPVVTITQSSSSVCAGSSATLTASGAASYTWSNGATTSVNVVSPSVSTNYTLTAGNSATCLTTATASLTVISLPVLTLSPSSPTICTGSSVSIVASGAQTYSWSNGMTSATIMVSPASSTTYTVTGFANTCSSNGLVTVATSPCTGIDEAANALANYPTYPNPFTNELRVINPSALAIKVLMFDALGRQALTESAEAYSQLVIETNQFERGIYILHLVTESGTVSKKLIKE